MIADSAVNIKNIVKVVTVYKGKLIIVKQFRDSTQEYTYELPGGKVNGNEEIRIGAIRELEEETGLVTNELIELGAFKVPAGNILTTLFFTNNIINRTTQSLDSDELIEVIDIDIETAFKKIGNGEWKDYRLGIGLILARTRGLIS